MSAPRSNARLLALRIEPRFSAVREAAAQFRAFAAERLLERDLWACELAFVEACNNAIQHGRAASPVEAEILLEERSVKIQIRDDNAAFILPSETEPPPAAQENGRGLFLIKNLMDEVRCERTSAMNSLVLRKNIAGI